MLDFQVCEFSRFNFSTFLQVNMAMKREIGLSCLIILGLAPWTAVAQVRFLLIAEPDQQSVVQNFTDGIAQAQADNNGVTIDFTKINVRKTFSVGHDLTLFFYQD